MKKKNNDKIRAYVTKIIEIKVKEEVDNFYQKLKEEYKINNELTLQNSKLKNEFENLKSEKKELKRINEKLKKMIRNERKEKKN
jgi:hypothetical protein